MKLEAEKKFLGVPTEISKNFWRYPRVAEDYWPLLTGAQQKVYDLILRKTWGWNKYSDKISLTQFERGTGLSRKHIIRSYRSLEKMGFVIITKNRVANEFTLVTETQQETGTKVNQTGELVSLPVGDKTILDPSTTEIHTINNLSIEETIEKIYQYYSLKIFPGTRKDEPVRLTKKAKQKIMQRLVEYEPEKLRTAMKNFSIDEWMMRNNGTRGIAWFFDSEDRIEQFLNLGKLDDFSN